MFCTLHQPNGTGTRLGKRMHRDLVYHTTHSRALQQHSVAPAPALLAHLRKGESVGRRAEAVASRGGGCSPAEAGAGVPPATPTKPCAKEPALCSSAARPPVGCETGRLLLNAPTTAVKHRACGAWVGVTMCLPFYQKKKLLLLHLKCSLPKVADPAGHRLTVLGEDGSKVGREEEGREGGNGLLLEDAAHKDYAGAKLYKHDFPTQHRSPCRAPCMHLCHAPAPLPPLPLLAHLWVAVLVRLGDRGPEAGSR